MSCSITQYAAQRPTPHFLRNAIHILTKNIEGWVVGLRNRFENLEDHPQCTTLASGRLRYWLWQ